jgi:predicted ABC-type ATPase
VVVGETPKVLILAGPNGAGKTTFAREFLVHEADCPTFINADLIAAGLSPFAPERVAVMAGRIMLGLISEAVGRGESFAFETTLAGRNFARAIPQWRAAGYVVTLIFLSLPSADLAVDRVAERARHGGHAVPEETIRRRFAAGLANFHGVYKTLVDEWLLFDNSTRPPVLLDSGANPGATHE